MAGDLLTLSLPLIELQLFVLKCVVSVQRNCSTVIIQIKFLGLAMCKKKKRYGFLRVYMDISGYTSSLQRLSREEQKYLGDFLVFLLSPYLSLYLLLRFLCPFLHVFYSAFPPVLSYTFTTGFTSAKTIALSSLRVPDLYMYTLIC